MNGYRLNITSEELTETLAIASNPLSSKMSLEDSLSKEVAVDYSNDKFHLFFPTQSTYSAMNGIKGGKYYSLGALDIVEDFNLGSIEKSDKPSIISFMLYSTETASTFDGPLSWVFPEGVDMVGGSIINDLYENTVVNVCNNIARVTKVYNVNTTFDKVILSDDSVVVGNDRGASTGIFGFVYNGTAWDLADVNIPDDVTKSDIVKIELGNKYPFHSLKLNDLSNLQEIVIPKNTAGIWIFINDSGLGDIINSNIIQNGLTLTYEGTEYEWNKFISSKYKRINTSFTYNSEEYTIPVTMNFEGDN